MSQLHKRFSSDQVKELLQPYLEDKVERKCILHIVPVMFFFWLGLAIRF
jgi:hypothetical protein